MRCTWLVQQHDEAGPGSKTMACPVTAAMCDVVPSSHGRPGLPHYLLLALPPASGTMVAPPSKGRFQVPPCPRGPSEELETLEAEVTLQDGASRLRAVLSRCPLVGRPRCPEGHHSLTSYLCHELRSYLPGLLASGWLQNLLVCMSHCVKVVLGPLWKVRTRDSLSPDRFEGGRVEGIWEDPWRVGIWMSLTSSHWRDSFKEV